MQYQYNEEQSQFKDMLRKFVQDKYGYDCHLALCKSEQGYSEEHWQQFAELGLLGLPFSENVGGLGVDSGFLMAIAEEFGRGLVLEPYIATVVLAGGLLAKADNSDLSNVLLPKLVAGDLKLCLAWEERASRGNPLDVNATATRSHIGDNLLINGEKCVVLGASSADKLIVTAVAEDGGLNAYLIDCDAVGLHVQAQTLADGQRAGQIRFCNVEISADAALFSDGKAAATLQETLHEALLVMAADGLGAMDQLLALSLDYCKTRQQFGVPIATFQTLQHRLSDMMIACEKTRSLLWAAFQVQGSSEFGERVAMLKAQIGSAGRYVGQQAVQLHGGIGMTEELSVGAYFKRLTVLDLLCGNRDYQLNYLAQRQTQLTVDAA
ncbi:alkylation response protein AidB-like acyl-CoA dehydrogenase [Zhongshania antarctica]|uniref:Alkylation response protein AidB-like acyl-CoA dehydrogenase n=1 Tax=Zhongshania antarctica TaxID=641702 RepID=A0A840QZT5_9GAMM|nr:acyl-CoA dehydrogenase [Zhongshania antarctica]MBB5185913.1 alkylation response protein AidB-like acyl-CoA dehydrogenase [Zhongshania antarctica]